MTRPMNTVSASHLSCDHFSGHRDISRILIGVAPAGTSFTSIGLEERMPFHCIAQAPTDHQHGAVHRVPSLSEVLRFNWTPAGSAIRELGGARLERSYRRLSIGTDYRNVLMYLRYDETLFGVTGLVRAATEPAFSQDELSDLSALAQLAGLTARLQVLYINKLYENAALRALGGGEGLNVMVDQDLGDIVWASAGEEEVVWARDVQPIAPMIVEATRSLSTTDRSSSERCFLHSNGARIITVCVADGSTIGVARCAAVRVRCSRPFGSLSQREREVATMIANGYANLNIAAKVGVSENTVRTYVRRLYQKLGVCSRVQLANLMLSRP